ncbi:hypothetical protein DM02DRAFT_312179 [Periconia macrospinosa]|uniref:Uncharacterized protein n=1 Tax=Periconia macrospinosa TaxID=97972 RepID=A0A2V1DVE4_9PLEO|nr:hypothetical protein DM02DRAFT_312179 [Periconia macrospinosa]
MFPRIGMPHKRRQVNSLEWREGERYTVRTKMSLRQSGVGERTTTAIQRHSVTVYESRSTASFDDIPFTIILPFPSLHVKKKKPCGGDVSERAHVCVCGGIITARPSAPDLLHLTSSCCSIPRTPTFLRPYDADQNQIKREAQIKPLHCFKRNPTDVPVIVCARSVRGGSRVSRR